MIRPHEHPDLLPVDEIQPAPELVNLSVGAPIPQTGTRNPTYAVLISEILGPRDGPEKDKNPTSPIVV